MNIVFGETLKNYYPISLGYSCHVKVLIEQICEMERWKYPRLPFDWIGTPMSSVYEMAISNFYEMVEPSKLVVRKRFSGKDTEYLTHTDYNFVFVHDFKRLRSIPPAEFAKVESDYARRIERWNNLLLCGRRLLFLRLEQDGGDRIVYEGTEREDDEYTYLQKFSQYIQSRKIPFFVIFLSQTRTKGYDADHKILTIHYKKDKPETIVSGDHLGCILRAHVPFIESVAF